MMMSEMRREICIPAGQAMAEYAFAYAMIGAVCILVLCLTSRGLLEFGRDYSAEFQAATGNSVAFLSVVQPVEIGIVLPSEGIRPEAGGGDGLRGMGVKTALPEGKRQTETLGGAAKGL